MPFELRASPRAPSLAEVDDAGEQVLAAIVGSCDPAAGFREQVKEGLTAALDLVVANPELVAPLTDASRSTAVAARQDEWQRVFGERLRSAAARAPGISPTPGFLERYLVASVRRQASDLVRDGRGEELIDRVPLLLRYTLAYYPRSRADLPRRH